MIYIAKRGRIFGKQGVMHRLLILPLLLLTLFCAKANAEEVITNFHSLIEVAKNGDLTVTETIAVVAEGNEIIRGIYRDFPRSFLDENDTIRRVSFDILSIKRNGNEEPYHTVSVNGDTRIYIGDKDVRVAKGPHTYEIKYRTDRQIGFYERHDEVYWNVTGNGWAFPIQKATAEVILPEGEDFYDLDLFTGYAGQDELKGQGYFEENRRRAVFNTIEPLAVNQGLTILATMRKGVVNPPNTFQKLKWFMRDSGHTFIGFLTLLIIGGYYAITWHRVGRDPLRKPTRPNWSAPDGISPALAYFIVNKERLNNSWKALTASIINLSVQGYLLVEDLESKPLLTATDKEHGNLTAEEAAIMDIVADREAFRLSSANGESIRSMEISFSNALEDGNKEAFYKHNLSYVIPGLVLSAVGLLSTMFFNFTALFAILITSLLGGIFAGFATPIVLAARWVWRLPAGGQRNVYLVVIAAVALLLLNGAWWVLRSVLNDAATIQNLPFVFAFLSIVGANCAFYFLMGAPTQKGVESTRAIESLRLYLNLQEEDRSSLMGAPEMSPEHYEELLPYAIALGIEQKWSSAFEDWLSNATSSARNRNYRPHWSRDRWRSHRDITRRFGTIGNTMSQSLSTSTPRSTSSSGSSSGSSGGGGGGGGGGGW